MAIEPNSIAAACSHSTAAIDITRTGGRLSTKVWFVERCMNCGQELDRKRAPRSYDVYSKREKPA